VPTSSRCVHLPRPPPRRTPKSRSFSMTDRRHLSRRTPATILVRLDDARQLSNAVAFIRPAGQLPPWTPRAPAAGAPSPQAPRPPTDARHCTQPYDSIPAVPPVRLACLTNSSLQNCPPRAAGLDPDHQPRPSDGGTDRVRGAVRPPSLASRPAPGSTTEVTTTTCGTIPASPATSRSARWVDTRMHPVA